MAIVSCPECQKKLKVADASVGKKVRCSCGQVFVAQVEVVPAAVAAPVGADKVIVACTECGAKLKVAGTSLGKKMKCPKCTAVFVAALDKPPVEDESLDAPVLKSKAKSEKSEDDLFSFAEGEERDEDAPVRGQGKRADADFAEVDDEAPAKGKGKPVRKPVPDDEDDEPWAKGKSKSAEIDDDDDEPMPKGKPDKKATRPPLKQGSDKPVYPSRLLLNLFVTLMLILYIAAFAVLYFGDDLGAMAGVKDGIHAEMIGLQRPSISEPAGRKIQIQPDENEPQTKIDAELLQRDWVIHSALRKGVDFPGLRGLKVTFTPENEIKCGSSELAGKYELKPQLSPTGIDLTPNQQRVPVIPGILKMDGDSLILCLANMEPTKGAKNIIWKIGERPTDFDAKTARTYVLKPAPAKKKNP